MGAEAGAASAATLNEQAGEHAQAAPRERHTTRKALCIPLPANLSFAAAAVLQELRRRQRLAEIEALRDGQPRSCSSLCLGGGFHALGHQLLAQDLSHGNDGAGDGIAGTARLHGGDERAIHLEYIDGQHLQHGQGRVAGAEIIDGDAHP
jgi:hypothetical protein